MKVSIITATFNSERSIDSAIQTVNQQDYDNIEHVFVDGRSTDTTLEIIKSKSKRDPLILSEDDSGIYDALNKGIKICNGEIIGFLHSDDLLSSATIISEIVNSFKNDGIDGVYGDIQYVDKMHPTKIIRYWKSKAYTTNLIKRGWMPPHPTLFLKREIYQQFGSFDIDFKIAADYDFVLRIFTRNENLRFKYLPIIFTYMRVGGESNKNVSNIILKSREDFRALRKNGIKNPASVLAAKNMSKIPQFFKF